ncbi:hypothetical protein [Streptomyces sannanensis]
MPASERDAHQRPPSPSALSMSELLASCAAASAVSTPPLRESEKVPEEPLAEESVTGEINQRRDAA